MDKLQRLKNLWAEPTYRIRLVFFVLVGGLIFLFARNTQNVYWQDTLHEFGVVFTAVALIRFLWDFLGGDPTELSIDDLKNRIEEIERSAQRRGRLVSDILDNDLGIERIWPSRKAWQPDGHDGAEAWRKRIYEAEKIFMMSNTLWQSWMKDKGFRRKVMARVRSGADVRILLYHPDSPVLQQRALDERDLLNEMKREVQMTLLTIARDRESLSNAHRKRLQVRLSTDCAHLVQLIRADDRVLVGIYLSGKSGGPTPTFQLHGVSSQYTAKYLEQFDIVWDRATEVRDSGFQRFLKEYEGVEKPTDEL